jgi:hypothetical protein
MIVDVINDILQDEIFHIQIYETMEQVEILVTYTPIGVPIYRISMIHRTLDEAKVALDRLVMRDILLSKKTNGNLYNKDGRTLCNYADIKDQLVYIFAELYGIIPHNLNCPEELLNNPKYNHLIK